MRFFLVLSMFFSLLLAKNVLIINSYSIKLPWTRGELEGILKILGDKKDIKLYIEFMDTKVFRPTPTRMFNFYEYLKNKYQGIHFDAVITTDDNALNFIREYKNSPLFKNAKIFFAGVNNLSLAKKLPKDTYAGVFEKKEPRKNLELLKRVDPDLKRVYLVADNSNSGNAVLKEYQEAFKGIKDIEFIVLNSANLGEILSKLPYAPKHSGMILLTPYSFYLNGRHIDYKEAIRLISRYFSHPIVVHTDFLVNVKNSNIIGGKVTDSLTQGEEVAKKVLKYFNGEFMQNLGFTFESANKLYLNVKNLKKFGIDAKDLGYKNAILVNKPVSFFEIYKKWIIGGVIIFFVLIAIILLLYLKNVQLIRYNRKISASKEALENNLQENIENIKNEEIKYFEIKIEALKRFFRNMLLFVLYALEKNEVKTLKALIDRYLENKKERVSLQDLIDQVLEIVKYYEIYGVNIKVEGKGEDIVVNIGRAFELLVYILDKLKDVSSDITIVLDKNRVIFEGEEEINVELKCDFAKIYKKDQKIVVEFL